MITVNSDIGICIERAQHAQVPAHEFSFSLALQESSDVFRRDWDRLEPDIYMADGGSYRLRRYGLYQLSASTRRLSLIPGASFYQSSKTNPLNGGEHRHFAPHGLEETTTRVAVTRRLRRI